MHAQFLKSFRKYRDLKTCAVIERIVADLPQSLGQDHFLKGCSVESAVADLFSPFFHSETVSGRAGIRKEHLSVAAVDRAVRVQDRIIPVRLRSSRKLLEHGALHESAFLQHGELFRDPEPLQRLAVRKSAFTYLFHAVRQFKLFERAAARERFVPYLFQVGGHIDLLQIPAVGKSTRSDGRYRIGQDHFCDRIVSHGVKDTVPGERAPCDLRDGHSLDRIRNNYLGLPAFVTDHFRVIFINCERQLAAAHRFRHLFPVITPDRDQFRRVFFSVYVPDLNLAECVFQVELTDVQNVELHLAAHRDGAPCRASGPGPLLVRADPPAFVSGRNDQVRPCQNSKPLPVHQVDRVLSSSNP